MAPLSFRNRAGELVDLPTVPATRFKNEFGSIIEQATLTGAVAITKHNTTKAVLLSVAEFEALTRAARAAAQTRRGDQIEALKAALARLSEAAPQLDPGRLEQELALIAVKTDVTEELDRLDTHVATARGLLAAPDPVGRTLDFLMQEFNREANTLCSKAQSTELTRIGLDLKTVIDQMREQVQNLE